MLDVGWSCPKCQLVLAPSVAEHRCDPPVAGVTTGTLTITTAPYAVTSTTGHLAVAGGYLAVPDTDGMPPRPEITETAA